jgi:hypothetical protein
MGGGKILRLFLFPEEEILRIHTYGLSRTFKLLAKPLDGMAKASKAQVGVQVHGIGCQHEGLVEVL